jgi:putative FmdB family regulatory protein
MDTQQRIEVAFMPTYEYECRSCGAGFDAVQSMFDPPLTVCPSCGQSIRRKINGGTGIIFKGSGFYVNDSRKKTETKSSDTPSEAKSGKEAATASSSPPTAAPKEAPKKDAS